MLQQVPNADVIMEQLQAGSLSAQEYYDNMNEFIAINEQVSAHWDTWHLDKAKCDKNRATKLATDANMPEFSELPSKLLSKREQEERENARLDQYDAQIKEWDMEK